MRDAEGRVSRWYGLLIDIDDRKRAEEDLRSSEQNLRLIVDSIPGLVWTMTPTGEVEQVNRQVLDYFGKPLEKFKGCTQFIHPDDRERVTAYWTSTMESGEPFEIEHRLRRADGVYRWFESRGRPV